MADASAAPDNAQAHTAVAGSNHTRVTHQVPIVSSMVDESGRLRAADLLRAMDIGACMSAERHSRRQSVTLSMDDVAFSDARARVGDALVLRSRVNRTWTTSMEVGQRVDIETPETGSTRHLCSCYFTFVALDEAGKKCAIENLIPLTDREKVRWALAEDRRRIRLDRAKIVGGVATAGHRSHLRYSVVARAGGDPAAADAADAAPAQRPPSEGVGAALKRASRTFYRGGAGGEDGDPRNEVTHMVLPQHANHYGATFGGVVLQWCHEAAEVAAARHARTPVVTASIDDVYFLAPSHVGTRVVLKAGVNRVFHRSMEVGVRVEGHRLNGEVVLINRAYLTFVAVPFAAQPSPRIGPAPATTGARPSVLQLGAASSAAPSFSFKPPSNGGAAARFGRRKQPTAEAASSGSSPTPAQPTRAPAPDITIRSVPLATPDQMRRHEEALGRRRLRLERLQLRQSVHVAWAFTPDTNPRSFVLENLSALERVLRDEEDDLADAGAGDPSSPESRAGNAVHWGLLAEAEEVRVWSRVDMRRGVSLKTEFLVPAPLEAVIRAVSECALRSKWDAVVVAYETRHAFPELNADVVWLAVDPRPFNPSAHPTDFAILRSWRREGNTYAIASHSVTHHAVPDNKAYVRAETGTSGFVCVELDPGESPTGLRATLVSYLAQLNPAGTSVLASELDGTSKMSVKRMAGLRQLAMTLQSGPASPASPALALAQAQAQVQAQAAASAVASFLVGGAAPGPASASPVKKPSAGARDAAKCVVS